MPHQARRPSKKRSRHKRGGPAYALLCFILIVAAIVLALSVFFKISFIEVEGVTMYTESAIIATSGIEVGDNLFFMGKSEAIRNIFASCPYVEKVRIQRKLPDTLIIDITERQAVGVIRCAGEYWHIDRSGMLLEKSARTPAHIPLVLGIDLTAPAAGSPVAVDESQQDRLSAVQVLLNGLADYDLTKDTTEVDVSKPHELKLSYGQRFTVLLGSALELDIKLPFFVETLKQLPSSAHGSIDVSRASQRKASFIPAGGESTVPPPDDTESATDTDIQTDTEPEEE